MTVLNITQTSKKNTATAAGEVIAGRSVRMYHSVICTNKLLVHNTTVVHSRLTTTVVLYKDCSSNQRRLYLTSSPYQVYLFI